MKFIERLEGHIPFWIMMTGISSFCLLYWTAGYNVTLEVGSNLVLGTSVCLSFLWGETALRTIRKGSPGEAGENLLNLGLWFLFTTLVFQRFWTNLLRWLDRPDWMVYSPIMPLIPWSIFWSLVTILLSTETKDSEVPGRSYMWVVLACAIGFTIAGINIGLIISGIIGFV